MLPKVFACHSCDRPAVCLSRRATLAKSRSRNRHGDADRLIDRFTLLVVTSVSHTRFVRTLSACLFREGIRVFNDGWRQVFWLSDHATHCVFPQFLAVTHRPPMIGGWWIGSVHPRLQRRDRAGFSPVFPILSLPMQRTPQPCVIIQRLDETSTLDRCIRFRGGARPLSLISHLTSASGS